MQTGSSRHLTLVLVVLAVSLAGENRCDDRMVSLWN